ncbi:MAG: DJ-1/PfpI family protein [Bacillota bacterium]|nr:DJ-1/PfpI family protein [Bacillota bacterium]
MKRVLLLLPRGFETLEAAAFADVFGWDGVCGSKSTRLHSAAAAPRVETSFGHSVNAELLWTEVEVGDFDALALPGGFARYGYYDICRDQAALALLRDFTAAGKPLAAVCTAALVWAAAGIVSERRVAIYGGEQGRWLRQLADAGALACDRRLCVDGRLISGSAPSSAPYVALKLLEMLTGADNAAAIAAMTGYTEQRL